jgi:hypothetical protein
MHIDSTTQLRVNINAPYKGFSKLDTPDFSDDLYYRTEQDEAPYVIYTRKSDEQIAQVMLARAKVQRQAAVDALKVTTAAGNEFDGDEVSQGRMARAILALQATQTPKVKWVLANNTPVEITVGELTEALALAGAAQAAIWSAPYEH